MVVALQNVARRCARRSRPTFHIMGTSRPQNSINTTRHFRYFSEAAMPKEEKSNNNNSNNNDGDSLISSPRVQALYDKIVTLPENEVNVLGALVMQVLGRKVFPGEFGGGGVAVGGGAMPAQLLKKKL